MPRGSYHPNAYLTNVRNNKRGLKARSSILQGLNIVTGNAKALAAEAEMPYGVVMHHLRLLRAEGIVSRQGSRPFVWVLSGLGQKRLVN
jgi:DNA-binding transcriptional ArsR family regulator